MVCVPRRCGGPGKAPVPRGPAGRASAECGAGLCERPLRGENGRGTKGRSPSTWGSPGRTPGIRKSLLLCLWASGAASAGTGPCPLNDWLTVAEGGSDGPEPPSSTYPSIHLYAKGKAAISFVRMTASPSCMSSTAVSPLFNRPPSSSSESLSSTTFWISLLRGRAPKLGS